jgi:hypothetical protein
LRRFNFRDPLPNDALKVCEVRRFRVRMGIHSAQGVSQGIEQRAAGLETHTDAISRSALRSSSATFCMAFSTLRRSRRNRICSTRGRFERPRSLSAFSTTRTATVTGNGKGDLMRIQRWSHVFSGIGDRGREKCTPFYSQKNIQLRARTIGWGNTLAESLRSLIRIHAVIDGNPFSSRVAKLHCTPADYMNMATLWYSIRDVAASILLTGKIPHIIDAFTLEGFGKLPRLRAVKLRGVIEVDPRTEDFFRLVIEERKRLSRRGDIPKADRERLGEFLRFWQTRPASGSTAK